MLCYDASRVISLVGMFRASSTPRRLIWTVMFAVWFAALAPSVSAWLSVRGQVLVEVCTASGPRMMVLPSSNREDPAAHMKHKHCPYCLLQQDNATPPMVALSVEAPVPLQLRQQWTVHALPYHAVAWAHQPSRAPPFTLV